MYADFQRNPPSYRNTYNTEIFYEKWGYRKTKGDYLYDKGLV